MSAWDHFAGGVARLTKLFNLVEERQKNQEDDIRTLRQDNAELRKAVASLTERVAVLEEGRKTTAAEVQSVLTRTISTWENQKLRDEVEELKRKQLPPKPTKPSDE